jgi:asparagine synthase (glutamine-hydrolysing)
MMYQDMVHYLPDDILVKVDRASMAVALEARVPLLDHRVVEFAWRLPLEMKMSKGQGKRLLRTVLSRYVPPAVHEHKKQGFAMPVGQWLRGPLRGWAEDLLASQRMQGEGYLRDAAIWRMWQEHLGGGYNWGAQLWNVLMFQAWLEAQSKAAKATPAMPHVVTASVPR